MAFRELIRQYFRSAYVFELCHTRLFHRKRYLQKENRESAYHLYPILLKDKFAQHKKEIFSKLRQEGLGVQIHYIPVYKQPYYQNLGFNNNLCPVCEEFYKREMSIPMYPTLTGEDIEFVKETLFKVFSQFD